LYLLDTNHCSRIIQGDAVLLRRLQDLGKVPVDRETADIYGQFKAEIITRFGPKERSRRRTTKIEQLGMSENDLWIASTALRHALTLVSTDSDFQRMREVKAFPLESWLSPPESPIPLSP